MAVRVTLLVAPLLGVTLVLLALLPPSSHVASSTLVAPTAASSPDTNTPRSLPCTKGEPRGKRSAATGCTVTKGNTLEDVGESHMSKREVIEGPDGPTDKRAPSSSGFFGMRGKKRGSGEEETAADIQRAPSDFFVGPSVDFDEASVKRAPSSSGFFGMRGKKQTEMDPWYRDPKRARMGFFGTRGKKSEKRGPSMGFFGSRGKKGDEEVVYGWSPLDEGPEDDKRAVQHMGFFGMRGKKDEDSGDQEKRAAQKGFFGMRGKKALAEDEYEDAYVDAASKRAPMGFFGMRGKKDGYWSEGGDKRAPMGFFGMRGKKDGEWGPYEEEEKRSQMAFFGMRGKRAGDEWAKRGLAGAAVAAWPMSNGRVPYTLNSLLAYLGGRDASGTMDDGRLGWRPLRKRFRGNKKAPMGFIGMRGKKEDNQVWPPTDEIESDAADSTIPEGDDQVQNKLAIDNTH